MTQPWKAFEHHIVKKLKEWGFEARRTTSGRQGQEPHTDIEAEWRGVPFTVECKQSTQGRHSYRVAKKWFDKLDRIAGPGEIPVLVFNFYLSKRGAVYCLQGGHFAELLEAAYRAGEQSHTPSLAEANSDNEEEQE